MKVRARRPVPLVAYWRGSRHRSPYWRPRARTVAKTTRRNTSVANTGFSGTARTSADVASSSYLYDALGKRLCECIGVKMRRAALLVGRDAAIAVKDLGQATNVETM